MKAGMLLTGNGALTYITSHDSFMDEALIRKLAAKGIEKFIAYEIPEEKARERYGNHFDVVMQDLLQTDDLRILDYNGNRAFSLFSFAEMGTPFQHENG